IAWHASRIKTWQDALEQEFTVGGSGVGSQMETMPAMLNKLFGAKMRVISGYKGGNEIYLAMERGEVDGRCGGLVSSINATRPDWFPQRKITVPIVVALERSPLFPDVPAVAEFAKDERSRQILELFVAPQAMDRPILAPPGVPSERRGAQKRLPRRYERRRLHRRSPTAASSNRGGRRPPRGQARPVPTHCLPTSSRPRPRR